MASISIETAGQMIKSIATQMGVDPEVAHAILLSENSGLKEGGKLHTNKMLDTNTVSPAGARGLTQVMPKTLQGLIKQGFLSGSADYNQPEQQLRAGVAALKELNSRGITDPIEMAVGYNASPPVLEAFRKNGTIPAETANYLQKFTQFTGAKMPNVNVGSSSTSTTTSGRTFDADAQQNMVEAGNRYSALSNTFLSQLSNLAGQLTGKANETAAALRTEGQARGDAAIAQGNAEAGTIDNKYDILRSLGMATDDPNTDQRIINQAIVLDSQAKRRPIEQQIEALRSSDPLKNPLGWFVDNLKAIPLDMQRDAISAREQSALKNIENLQAIAQRQSIIQPAAVQSELKAKAYAEATAAKADAEAKIGMLQSDVIKTNIRMAGEALQTAGNDLQYKMQMNKMLADKWALSESNSERARQIKEADNTVLGINLALKAINPDWKFQDKMWLSLQPRETQDRLARLGSGHTGVDMGEAVTTIFGQLGTAGMAGVMRNDPSMGALIQDAVRGGNEQLEILAKTLKAKPGSTEPPELKAAKTDMDRLQWGIRQWEKAKEDELKTGDYTKLQPDNPYKLRFTEIAMDPQFKDNRVAQYIKTVASGGRAGTAVQVDEKSIVENATSRVLAGEPAAAVAQDLENFFILGAKKQRLNTAATTLGVPYREGYPVYINGKGLQLQNAVQIERFLTIEAARLKVAPMFELGF